MKRDQMKRDQIATVFFGAYNGKRNFMTPNVVQYGTAGEYIYELSTSDSLWQGMKPFGVTLLYPNGAKPDATNIGMVSRSVAKAYLASLGADI